MFGLLLQSLRLLRAMSRIVGDPEGRALAFLVALQLLSGTVFYVIAERWRWLDALYFCVTTLTTVGLGDLSPATDIGKLFTVIYILTGVGLVLSFITVVAEKSRDGRQGHCPHAGSGS